MEVDQNTSVKKPKLVGIGEEIVEIEDDEVRSTNKGKTTIVEEELQEQSQSISNTEKTMSNPTMAESSQMSAMILQKYISSEEDTSKNPSQEELVKDFTEERIKPINENYRIMQQIRKFVSNKSSLLEVRESEGNVFRIATTDVTGVSQVKLQMDQVGIPDKINFHK